MGLCHQAIRQRQTKISSLLSLLWFSPSLPRLLPLKSLHTTVEMFLKISFLSLAHIKIYIFLFSTSKGDEGEEKSLDFSYELDMPSFGLQSPI